MGGGVSPEWKREEVGKLAVLLYQAVIKNWPHWESSLFNPAGGLSFTLCLSVLTLFPSWKHSSQACSEQGRGLWNVSQTGHAQMKGSAINTDMMAPRQTGTGSYKLTVFVRQMRAQDSDFSEACKLPGSILPRVPSSPAINIPHTQSVRKPH